MRYNSFMRHDFVKPNYDSGGFAGLPHSIKSLLGGSQYPLAVPGFQKEYDNVILFLIDAFGWRFFEKYASYPYLDRFTRHGRVAKLTSQFPSTTSGHLTCIHTGLDVGQSGIFEWNYYEPLLDAMIVPLLFSYSGFMERDLLKASEIEPSELYPNHTLYQDLNQLGVHSMAVQHREYTPSTYSDHFFKGADITAYKSLPEALTNLRLALEKATGKNYFFLYYDRIDSISHEYGPNSPQVEAEVDAFLTMMERQFASTKKGKTLFLMTADHGQVEVDPSTTVYLNKGFPGIDKYFRTNQKGELLVPGGSPRDMFLYIKTEMLDEAQAILTKGLEEKADVVRVEELISQGYFGSNVSKAFRDRAGNLGILPYSHEAVWWYERDKFEQKFYGHHGGLTPQEMEIPLLAMEL